MKDVKELISSSSLGEGLRELAFGRRLRDLRLGFHLSVRYVCDVSNLSRGRLLEIEAGAPPAATAAELGAIAAALGVPASRLEGLR